VLKRSPPDLLLLRAPFVLLDPDRAVADGAVAMRGGRVIASGPARAVVRRVGGPVTDAGDAVLAPGLVNAHTHLELSALRGRLRPTADFAGWIGAQLRALSAWSRRDFVRAYRLGVRLALAAGTTTVGDVCRRAFLLREAARSPLRTVHHPEAIEPDAGRWRDALRAIEGTLAARRDARRPGLLTAGLSPHAPFTVSAPLYRALHRLARARGLALQTHLAETRAESDLLRRGTGPLRRLLESAGRPLPFDAPPGLSPVAYLDRLGVLRPPMAVVHGSDLARGDLATLARRRVTVVFCPRSHAFFRRPPHPVRALLRAGIPVALGTDSPASNRDLDLRAEMREVVDRYGIRPREAWRMGTTAGGRALGLGRNAGTLRPGAPADVVAFGRPGGLRTRGLPDRLVGTDVNVVSIRVAGSVV
jgi:cytosine/adenosine deaminase-related metal-dependent hydrolase